MDTVFKKEFWIEQWEKDKKSDTYNVHKGFSTPDYWDKASETYDRSPEEVKNRRIEKTIRALSENSLVFDGMTVLDIGCGTGLLSQELARQGAKVTALDFSEGMLSQFESRIPTDLKDRIALLKEDWHTVDIKEKNWEKGFDLVIAFMSPGVATSQAFFKMMDCAKKGCAIRGWAAKRTHPILTDLWKRIMGSPLEDKPQSILYKINLLFSMGIFPEIRFDTIEWEQNVTLEEELNSQKAFFKKVSEMPEPELEAIIRKYLEGITRDGRIIKLHSGLTATAIWKTASV